MNDTLTCYLYDQNGLIEGMRRGGKTYYFLKNMEGDVVGLLEKDSGSVVARYTYDDWGNCVSVENASGYTVGNFNPFRYRGYYFDQESGFYYVGSRYYDPEIGRWISPDSMENLGINGNVQSYNLYVYGMNNPINTIDNGGEFPVVIGAMLVGGTVGFLISGGASMFTQYMATGEINWKSVGVAAATGFVDGAVAASPLGVIGQTIAVGLIGGASYWADCRANGDTFKWADCFMEAGAGALAGYIGGPGANENFVLNDSANLTKKTVARASRKQNRKAADKSVAKALRYQSYTYWNSALSTGYKYTVGTYLASGIMQTYKYISSI